MNRAVLAAFAASAFLAAGSAVAEDSAAIDLFNPSSDGMERLADQVDALIPHPKGPIKAGALSPQLIEMIHQSESVKTDTDRRSFIARFDWAYDTLPPDAKYFANKKLLRWEIQEALSKTHLSQAAQERLTGYLCGDTDKIARSLDPNGLLGNAGSIVQCPGVQDPGQPRNELRDVLVNDIYPLLRKAAEQAGGLLHAHPEDLPMVTRAQQAVGIARLHARLRVVSEILAYAPGSSASTGASAGIDPFADADRTARARADRDSNTLLPNGREWLQVSLADLQASDAYLKTAMAMADNSPSQAHSGQTGDIRDTLDEIDRMTRGPLRVRDPGSDEVMSVDLASYYQNPPKDLKSLLPVDFAIKSKRPVTWDLKAYGELLPHVQYRKDVESSLRILSVSAAGRYLDTRLNFIPLEKRDDSGL